MMVEENKASPEATRPTTEPVKTEEAKAKPAETKKERPSNCASCNKLIKRKRWYYRNGKYYCSKKCWKLTLKKETKQA